MDECEEHTDGCSQVCINKEASFQCDCVPGFSVEGQFSCGGMYDCVLSVSNT